MKLWIQPIIGLCILSASLLATTVIIESFTARPQGGSILLEWRVGREEGLSRYEVERAKGSSSQEFRTLAAVAPKGAPTTYTYEDRDVLRPSAPEQSVYTYRIKIVGKDGSASYSTTVTVAYNVSGVRRTWGMIKEMFR
ncbi:MAG: hypothetical protein NZ473_08220 [Candidatus Kapabacteria bacterium]|nr:hypothetical protein [Candidatus Kapabacteria bacterium]MCS7169007.1 hypothetical protein [Candidatus Kapabacteria bacterium]MDW7997262.1 hypothetical protein [Bacteroidota bacterium]MDW8226088.1 hypothetical protein [Bacteroidota bacterium]